jgi:outer membrane cobalamin receptor
MRGRTKFGRMWLAASVVAGVQAAGAAELEEVVVTATKRGETDVQKLPESIHAISGADLSLKQQQDFESFAGAVPGLQFQQMGVGDAEYIIRGINGSGPSVVGAYIDDYVVTASDQQDGGGKNAAVRLISPGSNVPSAGRRRSMAEPKTSTPRR